MARDAHEKLNHAAKCLERAAQAAYQGVGRHVRPDCPIHQKAAIAEIEAALALVQQAQSQLK